MKELSWYNNTLLPKLRTLTKRWDAIQIGIFFLVSSIIFSLGITIKPYLWFIWILFPILIPSVFIIAHWLRDNVFTINTVCFFDDKMIWRNKRNKEFIVPYEKIVEVKPYQPQLNLSTYYVVYYNEKGEKKINLLNKENAERLLEHISQKENGLKE